ncbi:MULTISPECIES: hypothetical protein [unclassified Janthinobacterium]|uniref:hypothetical protein n=1 Tax=unclassified Janthinobacterium TaxID=2610881 RepID=UPI001615E1D6|nr:MULTISPECIES: hypothetical protein [unclassified Janthinobacterium]MBB5370704.1 hypothetical protein [Janthinobacterium sp. K2C7]MBB5383510.1 hypothetical protein [Janthinobacterium sp. K2Li3]MBB5388964.1 hypothetical protein [Janthinobacterium sp. K2E3]
MLLFADTGDQSLSLHDHDTTRQRSAQQSFAEPVGAPSAIPPIIINPYNYHVPLPAIDPRWIPPGPPLTWPAHPAMHMC